MTSPDEIIRLLLEALKLKDQLVEIGKEIKKNIDSEKDAKKRKELREACDKALESGKDEDLAALRRRMFPYARTE